MAHTPMINEVTPRTRPEPNRSINRPTKGEINTAHSPARLTAPENKPRDQPKCSVMGTTNTERVVTAISGLDE